MSRTRILVVEDEAIVARDIAQQLEQLGYEVVGGTRMGEEAPGLAERLQVHLVLMDIQLGGEMDGIASARLIRDRLTIPVVFLTAFAGEPVLQRAQETEPSGYIVKPFDPLQLDTAIRIAIHQHDVEMRLRKSHEELSAVLRTSMDAFWLLDPEGRLIEVNDAACRLYGYAREEMLGRRISDFETTETAAEIAAQMTQVRLAGFARFERQHRRKDGRIVDVEISVTHPPAGGGRQFAFLRDITEKRCTEAEREVTMHILQLINGPNDIRGLLQEVTRLLQQWSGCEAVGIRLREGDDFPYWETSGLPDDFVEKERTLCQRDDRGQIVRDTDGNPVLECMCGNILRGRFDATKPFFTPRGSFWTNSTTDLLANTTAADRQARTRNRCHSAGYESVALVRMQTGATTIGLLQFNDCRRGRFTAERVALFERLGDSLAVAVAHRQANARMRASEAKFATVFRSAPLVIALTTLEDGTYLEVNDEFLRVTGYIRDEVVGKTSLSLGLMTQEVREQGLAAIRQHGRFSALPLSVVAKDGRKVECLFSGEVVEIQGQQRLLTIALDVTERHRLQRQLLQAQKMEAVGQLAGGVAHDFNNILAAFMMNIGLLRDEPGLSDEVQAGLHELELESTRAAGLTRQLLAFSRRQVMQVQPHSLNELLGQLLKMLRRLLGENIAMEWQPAAVLPAVQVDAGMIEQVVMNLCVNARDAMGQGGRLVLRTALVEVDPTTPGSSPEARTGRFVRLSVSDTGCGIGPEIRQHLFEPFFTTKAAGEGTGLGLATVYGIVKQHEGWIEVESDPGAGSTFHVLLPALQAEVSSSRSGGENALPRGGNETVLLVEDEASVRKVMAITLGRYGYRVVEAENGADALRRWDELGGAVDLLLSDVMMPGGITGVDLVGQLRARKPGLCVVLVSGYSQNLHAGVPDVLRLAKPFTTESLLAALRLSLGGAVPDRADVG